MLTNSKNEQIEIEVQITDEPIEREKGLMHQNSLCKNCGMLFIYENDVKTSFWMKNTEIPLSIAFTSKNGKIMEIQKMEPRTTETHIPEKSFQYALEVNQGFFENNLIKSGDKISIPQRYKSK